MSWERALSGPCREIRENLTIAPWLAQAIFWLAWIQCNDLSTVRPGQWRFNIGFMLDLHVPLLLSYSYVNVLTPLSPCSAVTEVCHSPPPLWDHLPCRRPVCPEATEPEWRYLYTPCAQKIRVLEQRDRTWDSFVDPDEQPLPAIWSRDDWASVFYTSSCCKCVYNG